jgi:hypothetical protein
MLEFFLKVRVGVKFLRSLHVPCVLRKLFGPRREEVTEERKIHNEMLYGLQTYSSQNTIFVIKSGRMRWVGLEARMGLGEVYTGYCYGDLREQTTWKSWV